MRKSRLFAALAASLTAAISFGSLAAPKKEFNVCWTLYAGWMPWEYGASRGIVDKWAKKYGIDINIVQLNDYVDSINQYSAGKFDGCTLTNIDALTIPAAGGIDSTALIVGDFSNGNDGIVIKGEDKRMSDLEGLPVNLVEFSVSHYLLARGIERFGLDEKSISTINTPDAGVVTAFASDGVKAVTTWNPMLAELVATPGVSLVFDSRQIPGEIIDLMVVNSDTLRDNPALGKALTGAWYEIMAIMSADTPAGQAAREHMARASGTDLAGFEAQLAATRMFYSAREAVEFTTSGRLRETMGRVADFSFEHGLLGKEVASADTIGMSFAGGLNRGDERNIKLRFEPKYMQMAADGRL
jgi:NitT/TauT family transport system substrate-binding protein